MLCDVSCLWMFPFQLCDQGEEAVAGVCLRPRRQGDDTCSYLHELLLLLLATADSVPDGAHLAQDGLGVLQLVARRAARHLLIDPGGSERGGNGRECVSVLSTAGAQKSTERLSTHVCLQWCEQPRRYVKASAQ